MNIRKPFISHLRDARHYITGVQQATCTFNMQICQDNL